MNTLLLVDGNGLLHRSFHALPPFVTKTGIATNAVYGFATMLFRAVSDFHPTHIAVCFDTPVPTFRKKIFAQYQIHRPKMKDELKKQIPLVKEFLETAGIAHFEKEGYEADDVIGTISSRARQDAHVLILTSDRDMMQLVDNKVNVISPQKGLSEIKLYTEKETVEKFLVQPSQIPDLKSLTGDASDNYKGADGIGPKTASDLLIRFHTVQGIYDHLDNIASERIKNILLEHKKDALLSLKLSTIITDIPIDFHLAQCRFAGYHEKLKDFFTQMEFDSLIKRFFRTTARKNEKKTVPEKKQLALF